MFRTGVFLWVCLLTAMPMCAQQPATTTANGNNTVVPSMVNFSGVLTDVNGKPLSGVVGVTFALYQDQQGGAPLWLETQNVYPDKTGHYTVMLGSASSTGIPTQIFASGGARWLGVQAQGQPEQPRVSVLSVPYAMQAANAQTVGGLPVSAFVLSAPSKSSGSSAVSPGSTTRPQATGTTPVTTAGGTVNAVPLWDSTSDITSSVITQTGSGSTAKVGINTTAPSTTLSVNGGISSTAGLNIGSNRFAFGSYKTAVAYLGFSGNSTTTGSYNTGSGYWALHSNTTGAYNVADGNSALASNTQGSNNTATGSSALGTNSSGSWNTATGYQAMVNNTTGFSNTAIGGEALWNNGTGTYNTAAGLGALDANTTGTYNTAVGYGAGPDANSTNLTNSTAIGANAVVSESNALVLGGAGSNAVNVGIGTATPAYTLDVHGTGNFTGAVTFSAGQAFPGTATLGANTFTGNQTVNGNLTATGVVTGNSFQIGSNLFDWGSYANANAFLGFAGNTAVAGQQNTGIGYWALQSNVGDSAGDGWYNTAVGSYALFRNNDTSGTGYYASGNTALGYNALSSNTTGYFNTASGEYALFSNQTGYWNTATGVSALSANAWGNSNTAIGTNALLLNDSGNGNTASGVNALELSDGSNNTAIGGAALLSNQAGNNNTAVGSSALYGNQTGSNNTALGYYANVGSNNLTNATAIGAQAYVTQNNTLVLGSINGVNGATANTNVGIGTTAPDNLLSVNGSADKPGGGSWGTYSDRRLKTVDGGFASGLSQIMKLHPVRYRYKEENALGIRDGEEHVGLVAQDVQRVIPEAVTENSKGYLLLNNDPILWSMLNAIKEQQAQIRTQQKQIRAQQAQIAQLSLQLKAVQASLNTNDRMGAEIRTAKTQVSVIHQ